MGVSRMIGGVSFVKDKMVLGQMRNEIFAAGAASAAVVVVVAAIAGSAVVVELDGCRCRSSSDGCCCDD